MPSLSSQMFQWDRMQTDANAHYGKLCVTLWCYKPDFHLHKQKQSHSVVNHFSTIILTNITFSTWSVQLCHLTCVSFWLQKTWAAVNLLYHNLYILPIYIRYNTPCGITDTVSERSPQRWVYLTFVTYRDTATIGQ